MGLCHLPVAGCFCDWKGFGYGSGGGGVEMVSSDWRAFGLEGEVMRAVDIADDAGAEEGFGGG